MTYPPSVTTTLPIVAPCPACIHDRVCAIKGLIGLSKITLTVSILSDEVTPRAMPVEVVVDCSQFLAASLVAALAIDAALAPDEPIGESAADHAVSIPEPVVAAPPSVEPPAAKPGKHVRPLSEPTVACEPGCGVLIPTSAIGAHRRECEAVKAFKADHVTVVDNGEWPRPLPGAPTDVVAARVEFEGKRAAASRSAAAATWDRNHAGEPEITRSAHSTVSVAPRTPPSRRLTNTSPEARAKISAGMKASHARRRAEREAQAAG